MGFDGCGAGSAASSDFFKSHGKRYRHKRSESCSSSEDDLSACKAYDKHALKKVDVDCDAKAAKAIKHAKVHAFAKACKDVDSCSESEHSETESRHLAKKDAHKDKKRAAKKFREDEYKRKDDLNKHAKDKCEHEKNQKAFARKDKKVVRCADKNHHKKKKFHVRKFFEKKWEEDVSDSEDERHFVKDDRKCEKRDKRKDEDRHAAALCKKDFVRKEHEAKCKASEADHHKFHKKDFDAYCSEDDKSRDRKAKHESRAKAFKADDACKRAFVKKDQHKDLKDKKNIAARAQKHAHHRDKDWSKNDDLAKCKDSKKRKHHQHHKKRRPYRSGCNRPCYKSDRGCWSDGGACWSDSSCSSSSSSSSCSSSSSSSSSCKPCSSSSSSSSGSCGYWSDSGCGRKKFCGNNKFCGSDKFCSSDSGKCYGGGKYYGGGKGFYGGKNGRYGWQKRAGYWNNNKGWNNKGYGKGYGKGGCFKNACGKESSCDNVGWKSADSSAFCGSSGF